MLVACLGGTDPLHRCNDPIVAPHRIGLPRVGGRGCPVEYLQQGRQVQGSFYPHRIPLGDPCLLRKFLSEALDLRPSQNFRNVRARIVRWFGGPLIVLPPQSNYSIPHHFGHKPRSRDSADSLVHCEYRPTYPPTLYPRGCSLLIRQELRQIHQQEFQFRWWLLI